MNLYFDTETTGLYGKPHIVQLAFITAEDDGTLRGSFNAIIRPEGYTIPDETAAIHGITTDIAMRSGIPLSVAISAFNNAALNCQNGKLVAHNIKFDVKMLGFAYERGGWPSRIDTMEHFCTMEATKNKVRIPPTQKMVAAGIHGYKSPKLSEAYQFAFGKPFENAHDALYDVQGCKDIYHWLQGSSKTSPTIDLNEEEVPT